MNCNTSAWLSRAFKRNQLSFLIFVVDFLCVIFSILCPFHYLYLLLIVTSILSPVLTQIHSCFYLLSLIHSLLQTILLPRTVGLLSFFFVLSLSASIFFLVYGRLLFVVVVVVVVVVVNLSMTQIFALLLLTP